MACLLTFGMTGGLVMSLFGQGLDVYLTERITNCVRWRMCLLLGGRVEEGRGTGGDLCGCGRSW